ncbi:DNA/RNA non-specific endonuclease [Bacteroides heparinolyticus]|uniref:DNA/RNA non-specific endonuclease n=2 Tax=Prevotella heparinolytica TaxID=28113 RepID=UPI0035A156BB
MKKMFKILFWLVPALLVGCGSSDEPDIPLPKEKVIESTEVGSAKLVMLGYLDNVTAGGMLQPEGFATPVYIKDRKLCGIDYTFAVCSKVERLDAMPDFSTASDWRETLELTEGVTAWVRYVTASYYGYVKLRVAYIDGNKVGVEYKVASMQKRPDINSIELTESGAKAFVLKGYAGGGATAEGLLPEGLASRILIGNKELKGVNYSFAKYAGVSKLSNLPAVSAVTEWRTTAPITGNSAYWVRYTTPQEHVFLKLRVAYIDGDDVGVEYLLSSHETIVNENANVATEGRAYVTDYSIPHLNSANYYVEHTVSVNNQTVFNYALEWNDAMKHSAWVAFVFDKITSEKKVSRPDIDPWNVDPQLPKAMQVDNEWHKNDGFDKGHICASEDRVYSKEANEQTFYYSNISPQIHDFNSHFWAGVEEQIRKWGRSIPNIYDKVYVTKGGTLNHLLKNFTGTIADLNGITPATNDKGFTFKGLACPQYYYAAILSEKNGVYHAIAFLIEHKEGLPKNPTAKEMQQYVVSIDVLEQKTDLDFFCNLPDDIEKKVEEAYSLTDWAW